jgi:hypothetical protein
MKIIIKKLLHFIKRILTVLRNNCLPSARSAPPSSLSAYELFTKEQMERSFNTFKPYFLTSVFLDYKIYQKYIIEKAKKNDAENNKFYLEFGVWVGTTINNFSKYVKNIYGFDSFEGLKEDWTGQPNHLKGTFNLNKKLPKLNNNVVPIIGWVQDTLPPFLEKYKPKINFVHMDMDTYETTKFVLTKIKPYLLKNSIIAFDELYNYPGWEVGEYKALKETFNEKEYKFISFCIDGPQAALQII